MVLKDICYFVNDKIDTSSFKIEDYISTENMLPNRGGITTASSIPDGKATSFQKGDVLISNIRPYFKKIWYADKEGCCSNDVMCIRNNSSSYSNYLYYLLSQDSFFDYVMSGAKGTKMPRGDKQQMMNWQIKEKSSEDQRRIASILSSLDSKIETNNKINAKLEEMAQALFKSWFVDFEPFKDKGMVESELGMIPEGWRVGSPYEFVDVIYGAPYKSKLFNENKDGLPIIRIRDLKTCSPQFYSPEILPNTEYVEAGEILAGMDAEFIPYIWKGDKGLLNQRVCKIKPKSDKICKLFGMYLMKPQLEFVQSYKTGTTVSHLGKGDIDRFEVIIPPLSVVEKFSVISKSILEEMVTLAKESSRLSLLSDTLLPKLMSGEIEL